MVQKSFATHPHDVLAALHPLGQAVACAKNERVFRNGDTVRAVFLVLEGEVRLARFAKDGSEIALYRAGKGDFFAEAALHARRYHCDAIASQASTLLRFPVSKVRALLARNPEFAHQWMAMLARQLQGTRARLERLALKSAAERVVHYLHTEGTRPRYEVALKGTIKDFARELGLTHECLYRTLARLQRAGVIERKERVLRFSEQDGTI